MVQGFQHIFSDYGWNQESLMVRLLLGKLFPSICIIYYLELIFNGFYYSGGQLPAKSIIYRIELKTKRFEREREDEDEDEEEQEREVRRGRRRSTEGRGAGGDTEGGREAARNVCFWQGCQLQEHHCTLPHWCWSWPSWPDSRTDFDIPTHWDPGTELLEVNSAASCIRLLHDIHQVHATQPWAPKCKRKTDK